MNWPRIFLCGLLSGGVLTATSILVIVAFGREFFSALPNSGKPIGNAHLALVAANMVSGVWAIWLFTLVRNQQRHLAKAVFVSTLAWWLIVTQQSLKWVIVSGLAVSSTVGIGAASFIAMLFSVLVGAWAYERQGKHDSGKA
jgi:hypothetical protein